MKTAMPHITLGPSSGALGVPVDLYFELIDIDENSFKIEPQDTDPTPRHRPRGWFGTHQNYLVWNEFSEFVKSTLSPMTGSTDRNALKLFIYESYRKNPQDPIVQEIATHFVDIDQMVKSTQSEPVEDTVMPPMPATRAFVSCLTKKS